MTFRFLVVALYLALAGPWILLSDRLLLAWVADLSTITAWQSAKGLTFVALNATLIYWLAARVAVVPPADGRTDSTSRLNLITATVFLAALSFGAILLQQLERDRVQQRRGIALDRAVDHGHALQVQVARAISATYALAAVVRQGNGSIEDFEGLATEMLPLYQGVSSLVLAPDGIVAQVVPLAGNEDVLGIDIIGDPARRPEALLAMRSGKPTLAGPLQLRRGATGLIGRLAVFLDGGEQPRFWGFVTAAMPLDELLRAANLDQMTEAGYEYELARIDPQTGEPKVFARAAQGELAEPVSREIEMLNGKWVLSVARIGGWHSYPALLVEALLLLLASGLLASVTHMLLRQPLLLRRQVDARTAELAEANRHLEQEVAERRRAQKSLVKLHQAIEQSPVKVVITDTEGRIEYVNPKFSALTGYTAAEAIGQTPRLIKSDLTPEDTYRELWQTIRDGRVWSSEMCNRKKNGELFWEAEVIAPVIDENGRISHYIAVGEDVTERRQAQEKLERLNRALRVLDQGNGALVRAEDEASLLGEICRILVGIGGYCLVWVGMLDAKDNSIRPVMVVPGDVLDPAQLVLDPGEPGRWQSFVGTAVAERRPVLCPNIEADPLYRWCSDSIALCACHTGAALPLVAGGALVGVLVLHTRGQDVFVDDEVAVLEELAADLAYGIVALRTRQTLKLRDRAIECSGEGIMISAAELGDYALTYVNPAFKRITGFAAAEALGRNACFLLGDDTQQMGLDEIRVALREGGQCRTVLRSYRREGSLFWNELSVSPVRDRDAQVSHFIWVMRDITDRKRYEEQLERQANYDELTGLPNRNLLVDRLGQAIMHAAREGTEAAVLVLNLDNFHMVQDGLGHLTGDQLIKLVAARLLDCVRAADTVASIGRDGFVLVLPGIDADGVVRVLQQGIQAEMARPFLLDGTELVVTSSIGVSLYPRDATDRETLLRNANAAMHEMKAGGGNGFRFFTAEMNQRTHERLTLEGELRKALAAGELMLHYQPQVDLFSGRIVGAEALVRWRHPQRGMVSPSQFIPIAEETSLIIPMGEWILTNACRQQQAWLAAGLPAGRIGVNLSARQFGDTDLLGLTRRVLDETGLAPSSLEFELTESMAMQDVDKAVRILEGLKQIGVRASLDDFGTGHSSLRYLKLFSVIALKVDRLFVHDVASTPDNAVIVATIIAMAHNLGLRVIAEGVETLAELTYLRKHRCDEIQGYHFSPPLPADEYEVLLREQRTLTPASGQTAAARTLLLVDDEPNVLSALSRLFRRDGYRILTAGSAREALDLLAISSVQVILSDQRMPEMSGTEFFFRVKQLHPDTVRIVLSGYTDLTSVTDAINQGAIYKFLTKPWEDDALRETVKQAFRMQEDSKGPPGTI